MLGKIFISIGLLMATATGARAVGDEAPSWLQQLAKAPVPSYEKDVPAVVLLN